MTLPDFDGWRAINTASSGESSRMTVGLATIKLRNVSRRNDKNSLNKYKNTAWLEDLSPINSTVLLGLADEYAAVHKIVNGIDEFNERLLKCGGGSGGGSGSGSCNVKVYGQTLTPQYH